MSNRKKRLPRTTGSARVSLSADFAQEFYPQVKQIIADSWKRR